MELKNLTIVFALLFFTALCAQNEPYQEIKITGKVTNNKKSPLKGAMIFVDSINSNETTNRKGEFKLRVPSTTKTIAAFSPNYGLLNMAYNGQKKIEFVFLDKNGSLTKQDLKRLGFNVNPSKEEQEARLYANFSSVLEILDQRFYNVRVQNGRIIVGKGPNSFSGDSDPLVYVDNQRVPVSTLSTIAPIEVKSIKVLNRGSEAAAYGGLQAANGVILIELK